MGKFSFRIPMPSRGGITPTTHLDKLVQLRLELFEPGLFHFVLLDERGFDRAKLFPFLLKAFPLCELERQPCEHELVRRLVCVAFG